MKTVLAQRDVESNTASSHNFSIKASGKAFKILIDGLYANKIKSITRELWSNALDSHIEAGVPHVPFDVSFPTPFDPTFRVRDYGVGMTHETIMNTYSTLFESTKEDDNAQVGKWGAGSKSPFAYTDSFSVVAYDGTTARHYSAMIGEEYVPIIHYMGSTEDTSARGIEVSFGVDKKDVRLFQEEATAVALGFEVKPTITTADAAHVEWEEPRVVFEDGDTKILRGLVGPGYAHAQMGCVLYPIDPSQVEGLTVEGKALLTSGVIIKFPIGDLEVTASRENLSYGRNEPTKDSIRDRVNAAAQRIIDNAVSALDKASNLWDAHKAADTATAGYRYTRFGEMVQNRLSWKGQRLSGVMTFDTYQPWNISSEKCSDSRYLEFSVLEGKVRINNAKWTRNKRFLDVVPSKCTVYVEERTQKQFTHAGKRIAQHQTDTLKIAHDAEVLWIRYNSGNHLAVGALLNFLEKIEGADIYIVNEIELSNASSPAKSIKIGRSQPAIRRVEETNKFTAVADENKLLNLEGPQFFVPLENGVPVKSVTGGLWDVMQLLGSLGVFGDGAEVPDVYGFPKSRWGEAVGENWIDATDFAHQALERLFSRYRRQYILHDALGAITYTPIFDVCKKSGVVPKQLHLKSPMRTLLKRKRQIDRFVLSSSFSKEEKVSQILQRLKRLAEMLGAEDLAPVSEGLRNLAQKQVDYASECYELSLHLSHMWHYDLNRREAVSRYISVCDHALLGSPTPTPAQEA